MEGYIMEYGVALEGGGAKGAYHAGALKALDELNICIGGVTGTSIGAINGALYLQEGSKALEDFWISIDPSYLLPDTLKNLQVKLKHEKSEDTIGLLKEIRKTIRSGGLDLDQFKETLNKMIDEDKLRKSNKNFGLVTFSLTDLKAVRLMLTSIPEGELLDYLLASAYLPGFKREKLSGKSYIDGGFYDNLPINLLVENGFDNIITIELLGLGIKKKPKKEINITTIKPSEDTGSIFDCQSGRSFKNIQMGYYDTMRVFKEYYGQWFYLTDIWSPDEAFMWLNKLSEEKIDELCEILNLKTLPHKRSLFEDIVPMWIDLLKIPEKADYNMILLCLLEFVGRSLEIDRFRLFTMNELVEVIKIEIELKGDDEEQWSGILNRLLKATKLYAITNKAEVALSCAKVIFE